MAKLNKAARSHNVRIVRPDSEVFIVGGNSLFRAAQNLGVTIPAWSIRCPIVVDALVKAHIEDFKFPMLFEIAASEGGLDGGYTGLTIERLFDYVVDTNVALGNVGEKAMPIVVHRDHNTIKNEDGIPKAIAIGVKGIEMGVTSMSIDASHHGNADDVQKTATLCRKIVDGIMEKFPKWYFKFMGLELEVRDVGSDKTTSAEELVKFGKLLRSFGYEHFAIAAHTGTRHGNFEVDPKELRAAMEEGKKGLQILRAEGINVYGTVQHGTTGVNYDLLHFVPEFGGVKANVATGFQNVVLGLEVDPKNGKAIEPKINVNGKSVTWSTKDPNHGISEGLWKHIEEECFRRGWFGNDLKKIHLPFNGAIAEEYRTNKKIRDRIDQEIHAYAKHFVDAFGIKGKNPAFLASIEEDVRNGMYVEGPERKVFVMAGTDADEVKGGD